MQTTGVKIVATLGPSINSEEKIEALINAGASMFRVNSSHFNQPTFDKSNILFNSLFNILFFIYSISLLKQSILIVLNP